MDPLSSYPDFKFLPYSTPSNPPPITLNNTSTWTYCGPLLSLNSFPPSFHTWTLATLNGPLLPRLLPFLTYLHSFLSAAHVSHYWLTIRATRPTSDYDIVRWHTDDIFFDEETREAKSKGYWKLATTLLGPPTLFLLNGAKARKVQREAKREAHNKTSEHVCSSLRCLGCNEAVEAVRRKLAVEFEEEAVRRPAGGEVAFFRLGDREGAVHSEPRCTQDRIFVNVVPGTEEELKGLMRKWGMEFPRAWSFGVPVCHYGGEEMRAGELETEPGRGTSSQERREGKEVTENVGGEVESTMSLSLSEEYRAWLEKKGLKFGKVFGQERIEGEVPVVVQEMKC